MDLIDDTEEYEPDSQHDFNDLDPEINDTAERYESSSLISSQIDVSREDSSFSSQVSVNSPGAFRKVPSLNNVLIKQGKSAICRQCKLTLITKETSRLISHVKKCPEITDDVKSKILADYMKVMKPEDRNHRLNKLWTKFMIASNLALRSVDLPSFAEFMAEASDGWKWANRHVFSERYLPMLSREIKDDFGKQLNLNDLCATVEFDHWQDLLSRSLLGITFTLTNGKPYLHDLINVSAEGHSAATTNLHIQKSLELIPSQAINSIVSDSASACRLARELIVGSSEYKRVIQHRCIAHLINRIGVMFGKSQHIKRSFVWASKLTNFISHSIKLLDILNKCGQRRPMKACETRWLSNINMVQSLLDAKETILATINTLGIQDQIKYAWINNESNWQALSRSLLILEPLSECICVAQKQDGKMGETVGRLMRFAKDLFTGDHNEPLIIAGMSAFLSYFGPNKLGEEEFALMLASYVLDRRNNCNYITEDGLDLAFQAIAKVALSSGWDVSVIDGQLLNEYTKFCLQKGEFSRHQPEDESSFTWWFKINQCSVMKHVACRIARLTSSSANIERIFSKIKWFQGMRRTNLSVETMVHLTRVRVHQNQNETFFGSSTSSNSQDHSVGSQVVDSEQDDRDSSLAEQNLDPEMCDTREISELQERFLKYVDFSIVNELNLDSSECQQELSNEEINQLKTKCRKMREQSRNARQQEERSAPPQPEAELCSVRENR